MTLHMKPSNVTVKMFPPATVVQTYQVVFGILNFSREILRSPQLSICSLFVLHTIVNSVIPGMQANENEDDSKDEYYTRRSTNPTPKGDHKVADLLREYHRWNILDRKLISKLLQAEHGIKMRELGLFGSHSTAAQLPEVTKCQLVLDQLADDPSGHCGLRVVKELIANKTGVMLLRKYIRDQMMLQEPEGFAAREPTSKKLSWRPSVVLGPHHKWSGDGHDKLTQIGFLIWGICNVWSGKWLGIWVLPNNCLKNAVAYLYLSLCMPIQTTTDCGSETTEIYGFANALQEHFSPHLSLDELPTHNFLKSVHNTTIECGWLHLRLQWGDNVKLFWKAGSSIYNEMDMRQYDMVQWLWLKLIQQELNQLQEQFNNHRVRKDSAKKLPSVDHEVVKQLMESIGGKDLVRFISVEYKNHAETVFANLGFKELSFHNVWNIFSAMLPLI
ncbi:hypothetical protein DFH29DRAFT_979469 [Suillus ampliporus]|nr:hypothetical protein DFH29DRAFT_979469 [Suillus ampliporus]